MSIIVSNTFKVLLVGFSVGLLGSTIAGLFFIDPSLLVRKLPTALLGGGAAPGYSNGTSLAEHIYFAAVGAIGSALGWVMYRGIVL